jgi:hypothetical protein
LSLQFFYFRPLSPRMWSAGMYVMTVLPVSAHCVTAAAIGEVQVRVPPEWKGENDV